MPLSFMRDTVTVLRAPLRDSRGTRVRDWEHASSHELARVQVTAASTTEPSGRTTGTVAGSAGGVLALVVMALARCTPSAWVMTTSTSLKEDLSASMTVTRTT